MTLFQVFVAGSLSGLATSLALDWIRARRLRPDEPRATAPGGHPILIKKTRERRKPKVLDDALAARREAEQREEG